MFYIDYIRTDEGILMQADIAERDIPSNLRVSDDKHSLYVGEIFDSNDSDLFECGWEDNPTRLNDFNAALFIISYSQSSCNFATDISGRELLYYYYSDDRFVVSDSFWGILKRTTPSYDELNHDVISEMIVMGGGAPCDFLTPVKGVKWLGANYIGKFDASSWSLSVYSYADIRRSNDVTRIDEAVESFDCAMIKMASSLGKRHPQAVFGLGLSGGLDSRTALHYLLSADLNIECFNVGKSKPHGIFSAASLIRARKLAQLADVPLHFVEWEPHSIRSKMNLMLLNQPIGTGGHFTNAYKYESNRRPFYDVLISGGQAIGPMLVGVSAFNEKDNVTFDDIVTYLTHLAIGEVRAYSYTENSIRKQLNEFGLNSVDITKGKYYELWKSIVGSGPYNRISSKIHDYVYRCVHLGYEASDITLDYRTRALGPTGRNGAYESGLGTEKSYTIYTPFLIKEALRWDSRLIEGRKVLKSLISSKMPEFARVKEETFGSMNCRQSKLSLFMQKAEFAVRGSGIMTDEWYCNHPAIRAAYLEDMTNGCEWFFELYPAARDIEGVWQLSPARMNSIWESKRLIDCIETKQYVEFD